MLAAAAMLFAHAASAQTVTPQRTDAPPQAGRQPPAHTSNHSLPDKASLMGLDVFSLDQTRVGQIEKVVSTPEGQVEAVYVKTGGFLGIGGKLVSVPADKLSMRGKIVQLSLSSEELNRLPEAKDGS